MSSRTAIAPGRSAITQFLGSRIGEILGKPDQTIDADTVLPRLGLDSLGLLSLVESVESDLQMDFPAVDSLDTLTIGSLAKLLSDGSVCEIEVYSPNSSDQMLADSRLPADIRPEGVLDPLSPPRSILLTGATGFLGAFLLRALLRTTDAHIVCVVRGGSSAGRTRIQENLKSYRIWENRFNDRIETIEADLNQPRLGLSPVAFDALAADTDVIVHAAAAVNWVRPYAHLRYSNVLGVRELLRFACRHKPKPFHFVSTLAVCYSTTGPWEINETHDVFSDLRGIHLAYAQSKCVAESLVRTAAERGLPASIIRPALISGDSVNGVSNTADFVSTLIKGCVWMEAAPDLDWCLDLLPVNYAADVIALLTLQAPLSFQVLHLANPKVRNWRELILWMNLFGYPVKLIPYSEWLELLVADAGAEHPLRDLLPFFRNQPAGEQGRYLPQLYEESRRRKVHFDATRKILSGGPACPELSTALLDSYFSSFIARQFLPEVPPQHAVNTAASAFDENYFKSILRDSTIVHVTPLAFTGSNSVIGELTSWKFGQSIGFHPCRIERRHEASIDVVVKVKARDTEVIEVGETLAELCSPGLGSAYRRFYDRLGLSGCDIRELEVYGQEDDRFQRHTPAFYGGQHGEGITALVLEKLSGLELMDSTDRLDSWQRTHIEAAIEGISEIHSIWYAQHERLRNQSWLKTSPSRKNMVESRELWLALAEHCGPMFSFWAGPELERIQRLLIDDLEKCWSVVEALPQTLIHNDFNPRNIAFRRTADGGLRLCVYDWELATIGLPQHDLAELLCFVLGVNPRESDLLCYVEMHRLALHRFTAQHIDERSWLLGFRLSLLDLMINRLPAYAMIHRFRQQRFLERVVRTWKAILNLLPEDVI